jgi:hypothetical protein
MNLLFPQDSLTYCIERYHCDGVVPKMTIFEVLALRELVAEGKIEMSVGLPLPPKLMNPGPAEFAILETTLFSDERETIKNSLELSYYFSTFTQGSKKKVLPYYLKDAVYENFRAALYPIRIFGTVSINSNTDNFKSHQDLFIEQDRRQNIARALERKQFKIPSKLQSKEKFLQLRLGESNYARSAIVFPSLLSVFEYRETRLEIQISNETANNVWRVILGSLDL